MTAQEFDDLFRAQYPRLVALGAAMTGSTEIARELAQETMLRAHARWHDLAGFDQPEAWLRRVMTNLLVDEHRTRTAERAAFGRVALPAPVSSTTPADSADLIAWREMIAPLPARQRAIIALHYGDDCSVDDIARMLAISTGTVKSALFKARQRLHSSIDHARQEDHQ
ncbi:MAG: sigma-70 family RNA polymerase sigma factor [Actinomycetota bacterium]|nr:sigma-70 family RNA polymerase sigma factor [Actinomycetota bacterium]